MKRLFHFILGLVLLSSCNSSKDVRANPSPAVNTPETPQPPKVLNSGYWQQHVDYKMEIDMDVASNRYTGKQELVYTNNSPDVLNKVFYHLYFNAFQPGSEMDVRSLTIPDPDGRVGDRVSKLGPEDIGFIKVNSLKQNGIGLNYDTVGTVLEVDLAKPIHPGESATFKMDFNAQVPLQIRRSGKNNKEGVALSMTQWYPKMAEYDFEGWHADPYIGREFHGVWGNFDVKLTIDKSYMVGGTGYLQNPNEIGHGYENATVSPHKGKTLTWHFKAPNVHDFTWAADPEYNHDTVQVPKGPMLHFLYKSTMPQEKLDNWKKLQPKAVELMQFFSTSVGQYPYEQYSIIQGGDGGMEYGMCTLILGEGTFDGLFGVTAHEMAHSWFQFVLASNEVKHPWLDEGFTEYICTLAESHIFKKDFDDLSKKVYDVYTYLAKSGKEQPQSTHADRYNYNQAYSISAYYKGYLFLKQLSYVIGKENQEKTIKEYFKTWAFKHPTPNDFIRIAEKISGLELDWYLNDWTQTTNTIDYAVKSVSDKTVTLERLGLMPMPIDLEVTYTDGSTEAFYIPLQMMRGEKPTSATLIKDWAWAYPTYSFQTKKPVKSVEIDPEGLMADIDKDNNKG